MKSLHLFTLSFFLLGCSHVRKGATSNTSEQPSAANERWNRVPISAQIPLSYLNVRKITFARVSSQATDRDIPSPAHEVTLKVEGENLLLIDSSAPHTEVARWMITGKKDNNILVSPLSNEGKYFHDSRSMAEGVWFHETVKGPSAEEKTWSIYLLVNTGTLDFIPQKPVKEIGYLVNYRDISETEIYNGQEPFNPKKFFITKWHRKKTIQWVISRSVPEEFIPFINEGILAWNDVLPSGLRFSTRLADSLEELDAPFTNAVIYCPTMTGGNAAASYSFYPKSGEIFRATLVIGKLPEQVGDQGSKLRGSVSHEVGHSLGLRHNFKGNLYDQDLANFPTGSSIMEYPDQTLDSQRKIGPYDRDAIRWAYADNSTTTTYPFCTDEMSGFDPSCQEYDPTSSTPFVLLLPKVQRINAEQMNQTNNQADYPIGKSPFDRIGPYLRLPEAPFYNAANNLEINRLFESFLTDASASPMPVGAQIASSHLQRIIDGAHYLGLSDSQLKTLLPALEGFNTWKTGHP